MPVLAHNLMANQLTYPYTPQGVERLSHRPTVAAALRYWTLRELECMNLGLSQHARIAAGIRRSYTDALNRLAEE